MHSSHPPPSQEGRGRERERPREGSHAAGASRADEEEDVRGPSLLHSFHTSAPFSSLFGSPGRLPRAQREDVGLYPHQSSPEHETAAREVALGLGARRTYNAISNHRSRVPFSHSIPLHPMDDSSTPLDPSLPPPDLGTPLFDSCHTHHGHTPTYFIPPTPSQPTEWSAPTFKSNSSPHLHDPRAPAHSASSAHTVRAYSHPSSVSRVSMATSHEPVSTGGSSVPLSSLTNLSVAQSSTSGSLASLASSGYGSPTLSTAAAAHTSGVRYLPSPSPSLHPPPSSSRPVPISTSAACSAPTHVPAANAPSAASLSVVVERLSSSAQPHQSTAVQLSTHTGAAEFSKANDEDVEDEGQGEEQDEDQEGMRDVDQRRSRAQSLGASSFASAISKDSGLCQPSARSGADTAGDGDADGDAASGPLQRSVSGGATDLPCADSMVVDDEALPAHSRLQEGGMMLPEGSRIGGQLCAPVATDPLAPADGDPRSPFLDAHHQPDDYERSLHLPRPTSMMAFGVQLVHSAVVLQSALGGRLPSPVRPLRQRVLLLPPPGFNLAAEKKKAEEMKETASSKDTVVSMEASVGHGASGQRLHDQSNNFASTVHPTLRLPPSAAPTTTYPTLSLGHIDPAAASMVEVEAEAEFGHSLDPPDSLHMEEHSVDADHFVLPAVVDPVALADPRVYSSLAPGSADDLPSGGAYVSSMAYSTQLRAWDGSSQQDCKAEPLTAETISFVREHLQFWRHLLTEKLDASFVCNSNEIQDKKRAPTDLTKSLYKRDDSLSSDFAQFATAAWVAALRSSLQPLQQRQFIHLQHVVTTDKVVEDLHRSLVTGRLSNSTSGGGGAATPADLPVWHTRTWLDPGSEVYLAFKELLAENGLSLTAVEAIDNNFTKLKFQMHAASAALRATRRKQLLLEREQEKLETERHRERMEGVRTRPTQQRHLATTADGVGSGASNSSGRPSAMHTTSFGTPPVGFLSSTTLSDTASAADPGALSSAHSSRKRRNSQLLEHSTTKALSMSVQGEDEDEEESRFFTRTSHHSAVEPSSVGDDARRATAAVAATTIVATTTAAAANVACDEAPLSWHLSQAARQGPLPLVVVSGPSHVALNCSQEQALFEETRSSQYFAQKVAPALVKAMIERSGLTAKQLEAMNVALLFHTASGIREPLLSKGFDLRMSKIGSFGRGSYFADTPLKASFYFRLDWNVQRDSRRPQDRHMLACLVALGRCHKFEPGRTFPNMTQAPKNFDSILGNVRNGNEICVYDDYRVLISHQLFYTGGPSELPPPGSNLPGGAPVVMPAGFAGPGLPPAGILSRPLSAPSSGTALLSAAPGLGVPAAVPAASSLPSVVGAGATVMVPSGLRNFLVELVQRALRVDAAKGATVRQYVTQLLRGQMRVEDFVIQVEVVMGSKAPVGLVDSLKHQLDKAGIRPPAPSAVLSSFPASQPASSLPSLGQSNPSVPISPAISQGQPYAGASMPSMPIGGSSSLNQAPTSVPASVAPSLFTTHAPPHASPGTGENRGGSGLIPPRQSMLTVTAASAAPLLSVGGVANIPARAATVPTTGPSTFLSIPTQSNMGAPGIQSALPVTSSAPIIVASAPGATAAQLRTCTMPESLKDFFLELRRRAMTVSADAEQYVSTCISHLLMGRLTADQFIANMERAIQTPAPQGMAENLKSQLSLVVLT